jgi:hypothetical protein
MLNEHEQEYLQTLMQRDEKRMSLGWFFMVLLALGGLIIAIVAILTLREMTDQRAYVMTLPGFIIGLLLIGIAIAGIRRVKERHLIASILRKLQQTPSEP